MSEHYTNVRVRDSFETKPTEFRCILVKFRHLGPFKHKTLGQICKFLCRWLGGNIEVECLQSLPKETRTISVQV